MYSLHSIAPDLRSVQRYDTLAASSEALAQPTRGRLGKLT